MFKQPLAALSQLAVDSPQDATWAFVLIYGGVFLSVGAVVLWTFYKKITSLTPNMFISPRFTNTSILMAYYINRAKISGQSEWQAGDMSVKTFAIVSHLPGIRRWSQALMFEVQMPFRTKIHLIGVPKNKDTIQIDPTGFDSVMEEVVLEGDYPNYFSLYADKDQQSDVRYHLDPAAMAFTVDFCQSHNWEIIEDRLYFLQAYSAGDQVGDMSDSIIEFVESIRPAVEIKSTDLQRHLSMSYGQDHRDNLSCPLCGKDMQNESGYFACPDEDGVLMTGADLALLRKNRQQVIFHASSGGTVKHTRRAIKCPSCGDKMTKVKYGGSETVIDSCTNCTYRWLDHGEIQVVK